MRCCGKAMRRKSINHKFGGNFSVWIFIRFRFGRNVSLFLLLLLLLPLFSFEHWSTCSVLKWTAIHRMRVMKNHIDFYLMCPSLCTQKHTDYVHLFDLKDGKTETIQAERRKSTRKKAIELSHSSVAALRCQRICLYIQLSRVSRCFTRLIELLYERTDKMFAVIDLAPKIVTAHRHAHANRHRCEWLCEIYAVLSRVFQS